MMNTFDPHASLNDRDLGSTAHQGSFAASGGFNHSYFDHNMNRTQAAGSTGTYVPHRSPARHIPIATDNRLSKFAEEQYHDMDDRNAFYSEIP